jgi:hypothetical protein
VNRIARRLQTTTQSGYTPLHTYLAVLRIAIDRRCTLTKKTQPPSPSVWLSATCIIQLNDEQQVPSIGPIAESWVGAQIDPLSMRDRPALECCTFTLISAWIHAWATSLAGVRFLIPGYASGLPVLRALSLCIGHLFRASHAMTIVAYLAVCR